MNKGPVKNLKDVGVHMTLSKPMNAKTSRLSKALVKLIGRYEPGWQLQKIVGLYPISDHDVFTTLLNPTYINQAANYIQQSGAKSLP